MDVGFSDHSGTGTFSVLFDESMKQNDKMVMKKVHALWYKLRLSCFRLFIHSKKLKRLHPPIPFAQTFPLPPLPPPFSFACQQTRVRHRTSDPTLRANSKFEPCDAFCMHPCTCERSPLLRLLTSEAQKVHMCGILTRRWSSTKEVERPPMHRCAREATRCRRYIGYAY